MFIAAHNNNYKENISFMQVGRGQSNNLDIPKAARVVLEVTGLARMDVDTALRLQRPARGNGASEDDRRRGRAGAG